MKKPDNLVVSVFMITYKHEAFIEKAVSSVLDQKTDFEYELIVSDDCSPDDTQAIVERIIKEHPCGYRVKYFRHDQNLGMTQNCNFAMAKCTAKYVAFCEGDDYWTDLLKLQKQVDLLESNEEISGVAHQTTVLSNGKESGIFCENVPETIKVNDLLEGRIIHTNSLVFRQSVLELFNSIPDFFSADRLIFLSIAIKGKFIFFNESMSVYRKHEGGISVNFKIEDLARDLTTIPYLCRIYKEFPRYRYLSYVYASMGLANNGYLLKRLYYIGLSFLYSFSYFPQNLRKIFRFVFK